MDVGLQMAFPAYGWGGVTDIQVYDEEIRLARLADDLGFDVVWAVEHHFFDYSFCPDNLQLMAYLTGVMSHADVGTAAVILPWNDPLRVAERVAQLDYFAKGKFRLGIGRGLSRREYACFSATQMAESRDRFDEAAPMILEALRTGHIEGAGPFYPQPRAPIRPKPERTFADRLYAVASSADSVESAARIGARMVMFADRSWEHRLPTIERHRELFRDFHGQAAPPPLTCDYCICLPSAEEARELAHRHMPVYLDSVLEHYEVMGDHFKTIKGYDAYAQSAVVLNQMGRDGFVKGFMKASTWGAPERILRALEERRGVVGDFELCSSFRFGGMPYAKAEESLRLFAKEVMPVLKTWTAAPTSSPVTA